MQKYKRRSPFLFIMRLADIELGHVDKFVELIAETKQAEQETIERLSSESSDNVRDDWLVDDIYQIDKFFDLSLEFAIVGLWRCVELYRKRAITNAIDPKQAESTHIHKVFTKKLVTLNITEKKLRCARSVDELRCLNNTIKHAQCVGSELEDFRRWRGKHNDGLGNLKPHYKRLRPLAEEYLKDLTKRLNRYWKKKKT